MKNIKFIKEPGYVYDLFFIFALHFNFDYFMTNMINVNKSLEETKYLTRIHTDFGEISNELLPFFYIKEKGGMCFMSAFYHEPYERYFLSAYNLQTVQTALLNHDEVITNLLKFYFMDIDDQKLAECKRSLHAVGKMIKASSYNDRVKSSLYALFIEPNLVIQKLSYELMEKSFLLSKLYERQFQQLIELQNQLDIEAIVQKLKLCKPYNCNLDPFQEIYVSFCMAKKTSLKSIFLSLPYFFF